MVNQAPPTSDINKKKPKENTHKTFIKYDLYVEVRPSWMRLFCSASKRTFVLPLHLLLPKRKEYIFRFCYSGYRVFVCSLDQISVERVAIILNKHNFWLPRILCFEIGNNSFSSSDILLFLSSLLSFCTMFSIFVSGSSRLSPDQQRWSSRRETRARYSNIVEMWFLFCGLFLIIEMIPVQREHG